MVRSVILPRLQSRKAGELAAAIAISGAIALGMHRYGLSLTTALVGFCAVVGFSLYSPQTLATALLVLAPLPSLGEAVGVAVPLGLEPFDVLVFIALGIAVIRGASVFALTSKALRWLIALNIALFIVAWYRTYGQGTISAADLALIAKPVLLVSAGFLVVGLLHPARARQTIALGLFVALVVIGASVFLQRAGLYTPSLTGPSLIAGGSPKPGGILLAGNTAGAVVAAFALPAYILLRSAGHPKLGVALVVFAFPVLLATLSRGSLATFAVVLVAFAVLERQRFRNALIVLGVVVCAVGWILTAGKGEEQQIVTSLQVTQGSTNAQLNGRISVWDTAWQYLDTSNHLLVGGGLDDFRNFAAATTLQNAFATHDTLLYALTTGGVPMAAAIFGLFLWLLLAPGVQDPDLRSALRLAIVGLLVAGITTDITPFDPIVAWLWVLVALAYRREAHVPTTDLPDEWQSNRQATSRRLQRRPHSPPYPATGH